MQHHTIRVTCLLLLAGSLAARADTPPPAQLSLDDLRTFTDVFQILRNNYVDELTDRQLMDAALEGMLASLDPHSRMLSPDEFRVADDDAHGRYAGVGVEIHVDDGRLYIDTVQPGGPAALAGVIAGELLLAVDGRPVRGRPLPDSLDALHGAPGTKVQLRLQAPGAEPRALELTRVMLDAPSVLGELTEGRIAYLQLSAFHLGSAAEMEARLHTLQADAGEAGLAGIVLDLRENFGGVVRAAVDIADGFLDGGLVVTAEGRDPRLPLRYEAQPGQWAPGVPMVVLVNGHSASAAEILAGALQDQRRAQLVGETTFGKGTLQSMLRLRNGGALKLTTARYHTPLGRVIDQVGLEPDLRVGPKTLTGDPAEGWQDDEAMLAAVALLRGPSS